MSSAYETVYFKESTTLQKSILVGFCLLPLSFRSFHLALSYLYHYFEIFGALESPTRILKKSGLRFGIDKNV